jgi:hypothetical protein
MENQGNEWQMLLKTEIRLQYFFAVIALKKCERRADV